MNNLPYDYAVIGGDMRQVYLAEELGRQNRVCYYALPGTPAHCPADGISGTTRTVRPAEAGSLQEACAGARSVICPIPFSKNGCDLNQSVLEHKQPLETLLSCLQAGQYLFAGCIPETFRTAAQKKGIHICDLMLDNTLAVYNTIATAEGVLCEAITRSPLNLHQSRCAVLGYGKCGSTLAQYLKRILCHVSVFSREPSERAKAALLADYTGDMESFAGCAHNFDFIFNTVPAAVITAATLELVKPSVTIIDIASAPGGVDYQAARKRGIHAVLCPGLPGKYAPASSAKAIKMSIEIYLKRSGSNCH